MNPVFSEYTMMLDEGQRALVASAFHARGEETGHLDLYPKLVDALALPEGQDVDIPGVCGAMMPDAIAEEMQHWGARVVEPRMGDPVSRLYAHVFLRLCQAEVRQRGKMRRRAEVN
jgi:hypothetical protein